MPLEGEVTLIHADGKNVHLVPGEVDTFDGGLPTRSEGICRDFNLMLKNKAKGEIKLWHLEEGQHRRLSLEHSVLGLYVVSGKGSVSGSAGTFPLGEHDFLLLAPGETDRRAEFCVYSAGGLEAAYAKVCIQ